MAQSGRAAGGIAAAKLALSGADWRESYVKTLGYPSMPTPPGEVTPPGSAEVVNVMGPNGYRRPL